MSEPMDGEREPEFAETESAEAEEPTDEMPTVPSRPLRSWLSREGMRKVRRGSEEKPGSLDDTQPSPAVRRPSRPPMLGSGETPSAAEPPEVAMTTETTPRPAQPPASPPLPSPRRGTPIPPPQRTGYRPPVPVAPRPTPPPIPPRSRRPAVARTGAGCLVRLFLFSVALLVILFFAAVAVATAGYIYLAGRLPAPEELRLRETTFVSTKLFDREGNLLWELVDPQGGRRTRVPLSEISPYLIQATIATEDRDFYRHPGFNPLAILRAVYQNVKARDAVSGASTITQQVARNLLLSPQERTQRTLSRKIKEAVLATELTRRYSKDEILEIYLNEINYGNLAYGIEAAAETYFQKRARDLNLAEASLLAGLPQAPATWDPFTNPEGALRRQQQVLALMVEAGYITPDQAAAAQAEMEARIGDLKPPRRDLPAPHFVAYVRQQLEAELGREALYRDVGLRVYTTLDPRLQALAEETLAAHRERLAQAGVDNAAIVVLRPDTGEILAMVGSLDFYDETIDGQVNVALQPRQPGSSIKPLTYVKAFELGWTPATLIWDVRTEFPNGPNPPYVPKNYDDRFHGPVLVRDALGNSYNIPAVKALQFVTVEGLKEMAARLGITTLTRNDYGLSLTLGGGEVKLLEMAGAYAVFANQGIRVPPTAIRRIEYADGTLYQEIVGRQRGGRVLDPRYAYLITDILADNQARCPAFGCPNLLELSRPAAVKTGTSGTDRDHVYDTWTIGYTPDLVVGVWAGNTDNRPIGSGMSGYQVATPIWHDFMEAALEGQPVRDFVRPEGIVEYEICADSGAMPTPYCPRRRREVFAQGQPPLDESYDFYQMVRIDAFTGLRANEFCQENVVEKVFLVLPEEGRKWVNETEAGRAWAEARGFAVPLEEPPEAECTAGTERPQVVITQPANGSTVVQGLVRVMGRVTMPNFDRYEVQYGVGMDPQGWGWISGPHLTPVVDGVLTEWDTRSLEPGTYTLRVTAVDKAGNRIEGRVVVTVVAPTPTPAPTATPVPTPLPTPTPAPPTPTLPPAPTRPPKATPTP